MAEDKQPHPPVQNQQQPSAGQKTSIPDVVQDSQQTLPNPSESESTDDYPRLYRIFQPAAQNIKIILQMLVGVILTGFVIFKIIYNIWHPISISMLTMQTLEFVGIALIFSTVFELAYTLFTPGPDEAVDPLITGLAGLILLVISNLPITNITLDNGGSIALLVLALVVLFILRYFFIEEKGWIHLRDGNIAKKKLSSVATKSGRFRGFIHSFIGRRKQPFPVSRSSKALPQQPSKDIGTNDTTSPFPH